MHRGVIAFAALAVCLTSIAVPLADGGREARIRVGLVEWAGSDSGTALGSQFHSGFVEAVRRLGLEGAVRQVPPDSDPGLALAYFARKGYDLVVMGAFYPAMADVVREVASDYPGSTFLVPDYERGDGARNVQGFVLRVEEASYLAGHLAAQMEALRPGRNIVSSVGGVATPPVERFIAGYRAGARAADPRVATLNGFSGDFNNPRKCRALALSQIAAGSGAVFDVAGACGEGALEVAKAKGVWGIGVDADYAYLGHHILTSVLKRYDVALLQELQAFKNGLLPANGTVSLGLQDGAVGLGRLSPKVPKQVVRRLNAVRDRIVAGKVRIPMKLSQG